MCGRYYIEISDQALKQIADEVMRRMNQQPAYGQLQIKFDGEIFPSNVVPVQTAEADYQPMRWGFNSFRAANRKQPPLIINARSETVLEKQTFRRAVLENRCLVPASGYYEWMRLDDSSTKSKYRLFSDRTLYFAGCYRNETVPGSKQVATPSFVILTQAASPDILTIHDRMPVIFDQSSAMQWLEQGTLSLDSALHQLKYELVE
ncbi:MAG: SOS response-associated peptidase [Coriobacteriia bacterium]|nr:SOS response-associated peptidase [Coriobacteriia bacterium]